MAWLIAFTIALGTLLASRPFGRQAPIAMAAGIFFLLRAWQACRRHAFKLRLGGVAVRAMQASELRRCIQVAPDEIWLGWGYRWKPRHAQLAHDVLQHPQGAVQAAHWVRWLVRAPDPRRARGLAWIHGLDVERDVRVSLRALEGHTAVLAVTGAMKTAFARLLVYQLAARGDCVIVIDPKGDRDLRQICQDVPASLGQADRAVAFQPAFARTSMRFDALSCWDRETQVASRLRLLMPGPDDNFNGYAWTTVARLVAAMAYIGRRASLASLLDCLQSRERLEGLALAAIERCFGQALPEEAPSHRSDGSSSLVRKPLAPGRGSPHADPRLADAVARLRRDIPATRLPAAIVGLLSMLEADRQWFDKMSVALTPLLTKLTAGELRALLSPDYEDNDDPRPLHTARTLIGGAHVAYFGLDALSDPAVAEALAALVLADLAATAGEIYNHGPGTTDTRKVHVLCDEWGDVVCDPLVQLANKARGAGVVLYLFGQTFADLVVKMGDVHKARRVLGNMNNLVVGASSDVETLELVTAKIGETVLQQATTQHADARRADDAGLQMGTSQGVSLAAQPGALVAAPLLTGLPDLQFFAVVNRAQVYKVRIPVLTAGAASADAPPSESGRPTARPVR